MFLVANTSECNRWFVGLSLWCSSQAKIFNSDTGGQGRLRLFIKVELAAPFSPVSKPAVIWQRELDLIGKKRDKKVARADIALGRLIFQKWHLPARRAWLTRQRLKAKTHKTKFWSNHSKTRFLPFDDRSSRTSMMSLIDFVIPTLPRADCHRLSIKTGSDPFFVIHDGRSDYLRKPSKDP